MPTLCILHDPPGPTMQAYPDEMSARQAAIKLGNTEYWYWDGDGCYYLEKLPCP